MAGIAALFTREFFETARRRLAPGGVMCQWAHTYDISDADLRSIVGTFVTVFPRALLWLIGDGDILLLGSDEPLEPRLAAARRPWPAAVATDLATIGATDPEVLLSFIVAAGPALQAYAGGAAIQTDDRLGLEFTGPRGIYGRTPFDHARALRALAKSQPFTVLPPGGAKGRASMLLQAEAYEAAFDEFVRAIEHDPADEAAADGLVDSAAPAERLPDAEKLLERLHAAHPHSAAVAVALSRIRGGRGDFKAAAEPLILIRLNQPRPSLRVLDQLAAIAADSGDENALSTHVNELALQFPDTEPALYYRATLEMIRGQREGALRALTRLRERHASSRAMNLLAIVYGALGRADDARAALQESMRLKPRDVVVYEALGALEMQTGNLDGARRAFTEALTLDPKSPAAREGLRDAIRARAK
jgi:Flp pilus assembly protein TadD